MTTLEVRTISRSRSGYDRSAQCLWYAWGRFDQAGIAAPDVLFDWARAMGSDADDYAAGRRSSLPSIMEQFYTQWPEMKP